MTIEGTKKLQRERGKITQADHANIRPENDALQNLFLKVSINTKE